MRRPFFTCSWSSCQPLTWALPSSWKHGDNGSDLPCPSISHPLWEERFIGWEPLGPGCLEWVLVLRLWSSGMLPQAGQPFRTPTPCLTTAHFQGSAGVRNSGPHGWLPGSLGVLSHDPHSGTGRRKARWTPGLSTKPHPPTYLHKQNDDTPDVSTGFYSLFLSDFRVWSGEGSTDWVDIFLSYPVCSVTSVVSASLRPTGP